MPGSGGLLTDHIALGVLSDAFPRELLDEVLAATGRQEKRGRLLPAHVVIRFVLALSLFFKDSYEEVMRKLAGGLVALASWERAWKVPGPSALTQARQRLGAEPMRLLFERAAVPVAGPGTRGAWLGGMRLVALDGTSLDVADTAENVARFGRCGSGPKASAFPKAHLVAVSECGTHAVIGAALGSIREGERTLAPGALDCLQDGMLLLADAGLYSWPLWQQARERGAHLCWRIGASVELPLVRALDDGSYLALLYAPGLHAPARRRLLQAARAGEALDEGRARLVRVVEYTVPDRNPDGELIVLATDLLDPARVPAGELAWAYHQRWEHETALAEMKSQLLGPAAVLRSKSPELVEQEIYGLLLTHHAIRSFMTRAADQAELDPDRLSFLRALRITRRQVTDQAAFPP